MPGARIYLRAKGSGPLRYEVFNRNDGVKLGVITRRADPLSSHVWWETHGQRFSTRGDAGAYLTRVHSKEATNGQVSFC